jgi:serine/threonine protein phosphatase PrpC
MPSGPTPRVDLSKKQLTSVPEESVASGVKTLLLASNAIGSVPAKLSAALSNLVVLSLASNRLTLWPDAVCDLKRLEKLHLEKNQLPAVPDSLRRLSGSLRKLYLHNNKIRHLSSCVGECTLLTHLSLASNELVTLPVELANCAALTDLAVLPNPLQQPPTFACKGVDFLRLYLRLARAAATSGVPAPAFEFHREIQFDAKTAVPAVGDADPKRSKSGGKSPAATARANVVHALIYNLPAVEGMCSQNKRDYMEDRTAVIECCTQRRAATELEAIENLFSRVMMLGIFDGHGGSQAAEYVKRYLLPAVANQKAFESGDFVVALRRAFAVVDDVLVKWLWERRIPCGSTAAVVLLVENVVYVAHCGDTRALLCRDKTAFALTSDHTPARESERVRIESRGGHVTRNANGGPMRVNGMLAVSRAFGDVLLKPNGVVTAEPDLCVEPLSPADEWLVMATDGLFDALSNQSVIDVVRRSASPRDAATALVRLACAGPDCGDNVSVLVVRFHWSIDTIGGRNPRPAGVAHVASRQRRTLAGMRGVTDDDFQKALKLPSIQSTMRGGDLLKRSGRDSNPRLAAPSRRRLALSDEQSAASAPAPLPAPVTLDDHVLIKLLVPSINGRKAVVHRCERSQTITGLHAELCAEHGLEPAKYLVYAVTRGDARPVDGATRLEQAGGADSLVLKRADEALPTSASGDGDTVVGASAENVSAVEYATLRKPDESVVSPRSATSSAPQLIRGGEQLPPGWHAARAPDGRTFYFDVVTRSTSWQRPAASIPAPWQAATTLGNKRYFVNTQTMETSWTLPSRV